MLADTSDVSVSGKKTSAEDDFDAEKEQLHAKVGKQAAEIDYLQKKVQTAGSMKEREGW